MSPVIQMSWEVTELYIFNCVKRDCFILDTMKKKKKAEGFPFITTGNTVSFVVHPCVVRECVTKLEWN